MRLKYVFLLLLMLIPALAQEDDETMDEPDILTVEQLFNVRTTPVAKETITVARTFYGRAALDETRVVDVAPRFDGFVTVLYADALYAPIAKGQKLFDLYSPELLTAQVELLNALTYTLGGKGERLARSAEEKLRQYALAPSLIARVKKERRALDTLPVYAPASGVLLEKRINKGSAFKKGTNVLRIADLSRIWIEAEIYQDDRAFVAPGQNAEVRVKGLETPFKGVVDALYPMIDPKNQTFTARIVLANPDTQIYPGMFADVRIVRDTRTILTLPKTAVIVKGDRRIVFVAGEYEGEYEPALIEAKRLPGGKYEILSGLEEGVNVVNNALFMMDSDATINGLY